MVYFGIGYYSQIFKGQARAPVIVTNPPYLLKALPMIQERKNNKLHFYLEKGHVTGSTRSTDEPTIDTKVYTRTLSKGSCLPHLGRLGCASTVLAKGPKDRRFDINVIPIFPGFSDRSQKQRNTCPDTKTLESY